MVYSGPPRTRWCLVHGDVRIQCKVRGCFLHIIDIGYCYLISFDLFLMLKASRNKSWYSFWKYILLFICVSIYYYNLVSDLFVRPIR